MDNDLPLADKVAVVTGANTGIGKETARELARMGASVALVCRRQSTGETARQEIISDTANDDVALYTADFGSLAQIRAVAGKLKAAYPAIHILVNNAGIIYPQRQVSEEGFELTLAVNHLAHFLLTNLLMENLRSSGGARIVNVSSSAHKSGTIDRSDLMLTKDYSMTRAYSQAKLANVLFTRELARRLDGTGITANALMPGVIASDFGRDFKGVVKVLFRFVRLFLMKPPKGARTSVFLAASPDVEGITGEYFAKERIASSSPVSRDMELAEWLWQESERLTGPA